MYGQNNIKTPEQVEYMAYPRANAVAEIGWSSPEHKNWEDYLDRLQYQFKRWQILWSELRNPL